MCFETAVEEKLDAVETPEVEVSKEVVEGQKAAAESAPFGSTEIEKKAAEFLILSGTVDILEQYRVRAGKAGLHAIARALLSLNLGKKTKEGEEAFKSALPSIVEQYFKDSQIEVEAMKEQSDFSGR